MHRMRPVCAVVMLAWAITAWARVDLAPETYKDWQRYDGALIRIVEFPGIRSFSRSDLLLVMATEKPSWIRRYLPLGSRTVFIAEDFASDLYRVAHYYQREGFPDVIIRGSIESLGRDNAELKLKLEIVEGPPMILTAWQVASGEAGGVDSARWASRLAIKLGKRLAQSDLIASADTLAYKVQTNGFARAHATYTIAADSATHTAAVSFAVIPGDYCLFGSTSITGLKTVSEQTIRRELAYRELEPYSPLKVQDTRENITRMEVFTLVNVRPDTSIPDNILPMRVETQETRRYRLRASAGYDLSTRERAQVEFTDLNFFGRGRRLTSTTIGARKVRSTELRLFWPHTPWNFTAVTLAPKWNYSLEVSGLRVDTRSNTTILSAKPMRRVTVALSNEIGSERVRVIRTDSDSSYSILKSVEQFSVGWDTRDNPLIPRRGHFIGFTATESGLFYGTDERWWRLRWNASAVQPIARFTSLAMRAEYGIMGPLYETPASPLQERFRYGGPANVRGWKTNHLSPRDPAAGNLAVGGNTAFFGTLELRQNIWGPVTLAGFVDAGNVWTTYVTVRPLRSPAVGRLGPALHHSRRTYPPRLRPSTPR